MGILTRATKNLSRRKTRALIVIIALSLALTLLIILPPSINAREALTQQTFNDLIGADGALNATVTLSSTEIQCDYPPPYLSPTISISDVNLPQPLMNESLYNNITSIPDVTNVIPILYELPTANRSYTIYGIPLDTASLLKEPSLLPANITDGRNLRVGDSGVVVLDEETAKNFSVSVGGTVTISGLNFTVVGIEGSELPQGTHGATMSLSDAQAVTNATDEASSYNVFVDNIDNVNTVAARISSLDPNLQVTDGLSQLNTAEPLQNQMAELIQAAQNNLNQIQGTGIVEIGIAVIADAAIILFIMLFSVRERTKEIGTLKAMGASDSAILAQFILEGIVLSLIAAIVAIAIGVFAIPTLSSLLLPTPVQVGATPETLQTER
jgi:ABC-type antimicrobial peptide transport system permease subunit